MLIRGSEGVFIVYLRTLCKCAHTALIAPFDPENWRDATLPAIGLLV